MRLLTVLSSLLLAAPCAMAFERLPASISPVRQTVEMHLDPAADTFHGSTRIQLRLSAATEKISLHARDLELTSVRLKSPSINQEIDPGPADDAGRVDLRLSNRVDAGIYTLEIAFKGAYNLNSVGLYKTEENDRPYLFTQFEMQDARRAFPSFDEPVFKFPYQITLVVPEELTAVSNTPVERAVRNDGWTAYQFMETPPLSSYHLAMAVGRFDATRIPDLAVPGYVYTTVGKSELAESAAKETAKILGALEGYFGTPYPYRKIDFLALPEFPFGAMENVGAVTYRDDILLLDPERAGPTDVQTMVGVIAHELAHMWYGNLVTMEWWNDLWLNEAFATWMAGKVVRQEYPELRTHLSLASSYAMTVDARPSTLPIRKPIASEADIMDGLGLAYSKGQGILSMIEQWIGEQAFATAIRTYMDRHAYGNTTAADLWRALSEQSDADVGAVMGSFLDQAGFPLIRLGTDGDKLVVSQERFLNHGVEAPAQQWVVPVSLKYEQKGEVKTRTVVLSDTRSTIDLGPDVSWVLPDAGANGYYRWSLPEGDLRSLARQAQEVLTDRERRALLANLRALLDAGELSGDAFLALIEPFVSDPTPEVVASALAQLDDVRTMMLPDAGDPRFKQWIADIVAPALDAIGLEPREDEEIAVRNLRPTLVYYLGEVAENAEVIEHARRYAGDHLAGTRTVYSGLAASFFDVAAANGDARLYDAIRRAYESSSLPDERSMLLSALGNFPDSELRERALEYNLGEAVKPPDRGDILLAMDNSEDAKNQRWTWLENNYQRLADAIPQFRIPYLPYAFPLDCRLDRLDRLKTFFADAERASPAIERTIAKLSDETEDCARLKERTSDSIVAYMDQR